MPINIAEVEQWQKEGKTAVDIALLLRDQGQTMPLVCRILIVVGYAAVIPKDSKTTLLVGLEHFESIRKAEEAARNPADFVIINWGTKNIQEQLAVYEGAINCTVCTLKVAPYHKFCEYCGQKNHAFSRQAVQDFYGIKFGDAKNKLGCKQEHFDISKRDIAARKNYIPSRKYCSLCEMKLW